MIRNDPWLTWQSSATDHTDIPVCAWHRACLPSWLRWCWCCETWDTEGRHTPGTPWPEVKWFISYMNFAGKNCRLYKLLMGKTCVSTDVIENSLNWNSPGSIPCLSPLNSFIAWSGAGWPGSRLINQAISAADHGGLIGGWETECGENNKLLKLNNILMITDDMTGSSRLGRKEMSYDDENFWELWSKLFKTFRFLLHSSPLHA